MTRINTIGSQTTDPEQRSSPWFFVLECPCESVFFRGLNVRVSPRSSVAYVVRVLPWPIIAACRQRSLSQQPWNSGSIACFKPTTPSSPAAASASSATRRRSTAACDTRRIASAMTRT